VKPFLLGFDSTIVRGISDWVIGSLVDYVTGCLDH